MSLEQTLPTYPTHSLRRGRRPDRRRHRIQQSGDRGQAVSRPRRNGHSVVAEGGLPFRHHYASQLQHRQDARGGTWDRNRSAGSGEQVDGHAGRSERAAVNSRADLLHRRRSARLADGASGGAWRGGGRRLRRAARGSAPYHNAARWNGRGARDDRTDSQGARPLGRQSFSRIGDREWLD